MKGRYMVRIIQGQSDTKSLSLKAQSIQEVLQQQIDELKQKVTFELQKLTESELKTEIAQELVQRQVEEVQQVVADDLSKAIEALQRQVTEHQHPVADDILKTLEVLQHRVTKCEMILERWSKILDQSLRALQEGVAL